MLLRCNLLIQNWNLGNITRVAKVPSCARRHGRHAKKARASHAPIVRRSSDMSLHHSPQAMPAPPARRKLPVRRGRWSSAFRFGGSGSGGNPRCAASVPWRAPWAPMRLTSSSPGGSTVPRRGRPASRRGAHCRRRGRQGVKRACAADMAPCSSKGAP